MTGAFFLKILSVFLGVAGLVGSIVPALPGPPLGWLAMLCVFFCGGTDASGDPMSLTVLLVWLGITVVVTVLDYVVPAYMTKVTGGHKAASRGAVIGLIAGIFLTPVGMILGSLAGAFVGEYFFAASDVKSSFKATIGAFLGFVSGTLMKLVVSAAMMWYVVVFLN